MVSHDASVVFFKQHGYCVILDALSQKEEPTF